MEIAAGGGGEVMLETRVPEAIGDEVGDALFGLEGSGNAEESGGLSQGGVAHEDLGLEDDAHEAGLIRQGYEGDAACLSRWVLFACQNDPCRTLEVRAHRVSHHH